MVSLEGSGKKKNKKGKKTKIISFDEELVTRDKAEQILESNRKEENVVKRENKVQKSKGQKKIKKEVQKLDESKTQVVKPPKREKKKKIVEDEPVKKKQKTEVTNDENEDDLDEETQENPDTPNIDKPESIRAKKRRKHQELLSSKKLKHELDLQQKSLNYLSKWKHSRSEWKFEKLKQIWLQQNLYDTAKIPDEFWETLLEYLSGSQGQIRKVLIKSAMEKIEKLEQEEEKDDEGNDKSNIVKRARAIVQYLHE